MLTSMNIRDIPDAGPIRDYHCFGSYTDHRTLCAIKFPFEYSHKRENTVAAFNIQFDVINGDLPFFVGLPALYTMEACVSFKFLNLGLRLGQKYMRIPLLRQDSHMLLPLMSTSKKFERDNVSNQP